MSRPLKPARDAHDGASPLRSSRIVPIAIGLYVLVVLVASFHFNISLTPDEIILMVAIIGLSTGRVRQFLKDWSIFLIVLLAWQVLTGFSRHIASFKPHVTEMISFDKTLFGGTLPTIWLQHRFYHPGHVAWYDMAATTVYMLHFVFPMAIAFLLWYWRRPVFLDFMVTFLLLALAGFATFVLFPAAPPWLAADWGYIPHVSRIFQAGINVLGGHQVFSPLYSWLYNQHAWDQVAAVPSEHAAFPFLCFLYVRQVWPVRGWIVFGYCLVAVLAIVYLGEHYVMDAVAGFLYAGVVYVGVQLALRRMRAREAEKSSAPRPVSDIVPV